MIKKKEMCFRSYRPISRYLLIIFTNREIFVKSWGVCSVDNADCHGCENEFEFEKFLQPLAIIEYHSHKVSQKRDNSEFIFLSIGIIIEKKKGKVARSMLPANIYSGSINTRFYTCILNTCATYLCIRYGIKYFMA